MAWVDKITAAGGTAAKFEKAGDSVEGLYVGVQFDANGKFGPTNKHLLKTQKGVSVVYAKPNGQLDDLFKGEQGKMVRVTMIGTKPSNKGNPQKLYKLQTEDSYAALSSDELPQFEANAADEEREIESEDEDSSAADTFPSAADRVSNKAKVEALLRSKQKRA